MAWRDNIYDYEANRPKEAYFVEDEGAKKSYTGPAMLDIQDGNGVPNYYTGRHHSTWSRGRIAANNNDWPYIWFGAIKINISGSDYGDAYLFPGQTFEVKSDISMDSYGSASGQYSSSTLGAGTYVYLGYVEQGAGFASIEVTNSGSEVKKIVGQNAGWYVKQEVLGTCQLSYPFLIAKVENPSDSNYSTLRKYWRQPFLETEGVYENYYWDALQKTITSSGYGKQHFLNEGNFKNFLKNFPNIFKIYTYNFYSDSSQTPSQTWIKRHFDDNGGKNITLPEPKVVVENSTFNGWRIAEKEEIYFVNTTYTNSEGKTTVNFYEVWTLNQERLSRWNGSSWEKGLAYRWNGTGWEPIKQLFTWNGDKWI